MLFLLFLLPGLISSIDEDRPNCYFRLFHSNGSQSCCLDEECSKYLDPIAIEDLQCQTHFLSLRFSTYFTYDKFLRLTSTRKPLASFFSPGRPNFERLLQIEFLSPLENNRALELEQLNLLTHTLPSNIDTYELIFPGRITLDNLQIILDKDFFLTDQQKSFDTFRFVFNCTANQTVEWELVQSIASVPDSPCPEQIILGTVNPTDQLPTVILTGCIAFACLVVTIMVGLILFYSSTSTKKIQTMCDSQIQLIERF